MQRQSVNRRKARALHLQGYLVRWHDEEGRHIWFVDVAPTVTRRRENAASLAQLYAHRKKRR